MRAAPPPLPCLPPLDPPPPPPPPLLLWELAKGLAATARRGVGKPGACPSGGEGGASPSGPGGGGGGASETVHTAASAALAAASPPPSEAGASAEEGRRRGTASADRVQSPLPSASSVAGSDGCAASAASGLRPSHFTRAPRRSPAPKPEAAAAAEDGELTEAARRFAEPGGQ